MTAPAPISLPILLTSDEHVPLYLQIVHQFRHLITSRQIAADDQLPSVRDLSLHLGVNSGTVALAYKTLQHEGLIESRRGRGTFVTPVLDEATRFGQRQQVLEESIDEVIAKAAALGFDGSTVRQYLTTRLQQQARVMPIVVVMPSLRTAAKYAPLVTGSLPRGIQAEATLGSLERLEAGDAELLRAYETAYFTFTFMSLAPTVDALLASRGIRTEVVGISAQLTPETRARLSDLDPDGKYCLVGESRNVSSAVNLIAQFSPIDVRRLPVVTELSTPEQVAAASASLYLHNFGALDLVDDLGVPDEKRLQLEFTISDESRQRLHRLLDVQPQAGALQPTGDVVFDY